ncbi:hypothetical protein ACFO5O_02655 [Geojedonia litorea]|uniref:Methyltransferase domain-containing protein n=1 Tax=Geojedonia litorea TaxID=1268269 RepID=A0ABV9MYX4_9FLAO
MKLRTIYRRLNRYQQRITKRVLRRYRTLVYRGTQVYCPICNWKGQRFFDEHCPSCHSQARTRLVAFALDYFNLIHPNLKLLHVAPNMNEFRFVQGRFKDLVCHDRVDIKVRKQINIIDDISNPKHLNTNYDLGIVWHVFEHIKEDIKAIAHLYRVMRSGSSLIVSVPIYPQGNPTTFEDHTMAYADFERVHGHYDHCRSCGLDYYQRFEAAGFQTETLSVSALDPNTIVRFGLQEDHVVWCFTK